MENQLTLKASVGLYKMQALAILILIFADGCDVGQFSLSSLDTWSIGGIINVLLHALAGFIFMACGIKLFFYPRQLASRILVSLLCVLGTAGNIVMVIMGMTNPNPDSVGVHFAGDWMVVIAIMAGVVLWFAALLAERVRYARA